MSAGKLTLTIEVGAKFDKQLTWNDSTGSPIDTSAYTAEMHIREAVDSATTLLELRSTAPAADEGSISLSGIDGGIRLEIGADVTDDITWTAGVYDLELTLIADVTDITRLIEGKVKAVPNVTRP
jgi:hypothetical protein